MVFQKPNPIPKSIYDNVAYGPRIAGVKGNMDDIVERALRSAGLWDEVKSRLKASGLGLSGGQQQRLCIARAIATDPERPEEHTSELQSLMRISYAVFCLKKKNTSTYSTTSSHIHNQVLH